MSLTTLKSKIDTLIEKAKFANMFYKWAMFQEYDLILQDGLGECFDSIFLTNGSEKTVFSPDGKVVYQSMFANNSLLTKVVLPSVYSIDTYAFQKCTSLSYIEFGAITYCTTRSFTACNAVETFKVKNGVTASLNIGAMINLSVESLKGIVDAYADMTGKTAPTLTIGTGNIEKLPAEYITKLNNKNISYK